MENVENNVQLISYCGLFCANCGSYKKGKCPGCAGNNKATWCKVRSCCIEKGYKSCADCREFPNPMECKKFNNFISKIFAFVFKSDRAASIAMIKKEGYENYAKYCIDNKLMVVRKS